MIMKKLSSILYAVILIFVVGTVVFLILTPDQIPVHFNLYGEADRFGSKYENLMWPLIAVGIVTIFMITAKKKEIKGESANEKIFLYAAICVLIFFTLLGFYFMWKSMQYDPDVQVSYDDINRFVNIGIGTLLVVLGNLMPKMRRNAMFGVRTTWSMSSDNVWRKSQRYGGIATVAAGFVMIISAVFVPGIWNFAVMMIVITVCVILCVMASRRYYLEEQAGNDDLQDHR